MKSLFIKRWCATLLKRDCASSGFSLNFVNIFRAAFYRALPKDYLWIFSRSTKKKNMFKVNAIDRETQQSPERYCERHSWIFTGVSEQSFTRFLRVLIAYCEHALFWLGNATN